MGEILAGVAGVLAVILLPVKLGFDLGEGTTIILFITYTAVIGAFFTKSDK